MAWDEPWSYNPSGRQQSTPIAGDTRFSDSLQDIRKEKGWGQGFGIYGGAFNVGRENKRLTVRQETGRGGSKYIPGSRLFRGDRTTTWDVRNVPVSRDYLVSGDINDLYMTFSARQDPDLALGTVGGMEFTTRETDETLYARNYEGKGVHQQFQAYDKKDIARNKENYAKLLQSERDRRKVFANSYFN